MVADVDSIFASHDGGIGIGGVDLIISDALIPSTVHTTILCSLLLYPVVTVCILLGERFVLFWRQ